jgi:hypothetical protein
MKKFMPLIAIGFIVAVIVLSAVPDYINSLRPFNKLVTYAKDNGFAVGIVTEDFNGQEMAQAEIAKVEDILKRKIFARYFMGDEAREFAAEQRIGIPGFVLLDGDGNVAHSVTGQITSTRLVSLFKNLHTH